MDDILSDRLFDAAYADLTASVSADRRDEASDPEHLNV